MVNIYKNSLNFIRGMLEVSDFYSAHSYECIVNCPKFKIIKFCFARAFSVHAISINFGLMS